MVERLGGLGKGAWLGCLAALSCPGLAMTSTEAVAIVLNSKNAIGARAFAEAKETVERAARDGQPLQQFVVGVLADDRELAKRYLDASRETVRLSAERQNNPQAWYLLSMESNDVKLLQRAVDGNNVQALNALGTILTQDALSRREANAQAEGVEEALRQGFALFGKAAAQCDANGFINLGTCYLRGLGCKRNMGMAFSCFKAAAEAGHPEGMDNVSACYQFGHGVRRNGDLCLLWAMRGRAARGDGTAAQWLKDRK